MTQTQVQVKMRLTNMIKNIHDGMVSSNYPNKARIYLLNAYDELKDLRKDMDD